MRGGGQKGRVAEDFESPLSDADESREVGDTPHQGNVHQVDDDGVLDVLAKFRGGQKECKFIIVTGESCIHMS